MERIGTFVIALILSLASLAQTCNVYDSNIRSLQIKVNGSPLPPPVITLGRSGHITIGWDELSHNYHRYLYRVEHCDRNWQPSEGIFESDYLAGSNNLPVEDYATSFNTSQLYTHYSLTLPNENTAMRLSGNYRVRIFCDDDDADHDFCVLEAQFCITEKSMGISASVSGNTDIDFQQTHQQLSIGLNYNGMQVIDPEEQLYLRVLQNRRWDNRKEGISPNIRKTTGVEYRHHRGLIFDAGNEFHRFEILNVHRSGLNVDRLRWFDPFWHTVLNENRPPNAYITDEDHNGAFVIRHEDDEDNDIMADYTFVHFTLRTTPLTRNGDVYVSGWWAMPEFADEYRMEYNEHDGVYEKAILLKQGYYDYQFIQSDGTVGRTMGNFYQTENEYQILLYYRPQGGRYDRLVGYTVVHS